MAVEGDGELAKRAGQGCPLYQFCYKVFLFSATDRASKGYFLLHLILAMYIG